MTEHLRDEDLKVMKLFELVKRFKHLFYFARAQRPTTEALSDDLFFSGDPFPPSDLSCFLSSFYNLRSYELNKFPSSPP